jgi:acetate kinase
LYLAREKKMEPRAIGELVNERAGLLGLSGLSSDMTDLLAAEHDNPAAAEAIAVFCYQARKYIGSFAAALDGVDILAFAGGIGENAAAIRKRICQGLGYLGVRLHADANERNEDVISAVESKIAVRVIRTNEELIVAKHAKEVVDRDTPFR